uniref:CARD domain-containing protein n=1 Tax=Oncorhynchus mykiss TaxID=8022 RepID=A0A8C7TP05_ONCMY
MKTTVQERMLKTLEDLNTNQLERFRWYLSHFETVNGISPIPKSQLEEAESHDTVDKMVQRYALGIEVELQVIDPFSPLSVQAPLPAATPAKPPTFPGQDFIPKHRIALETRLGLLQPILLHLEDHKVLNAEEREEVVSKSTKTLQNQALLDMVVRKGDEAQEKFYQVLREADDFLVRDLEKKKA